MVIKSIDPYRCNGCGECALECPADVIRMSTGKATIVYPEDCCDCIICEHVCPTRAVEIVLRRSVKSMGGRIFTLTPFPKAQGKTP